MADLAAFEQSILAELSREKMIALHYGDALLEKLLSLREEAGGAGNVKITILQQDGYDETIVLMVFGKKGGVVAQKNSSDFISTRNWFARSGASCVSAPLLKGDICVFMKQNPLTLDDVEGDAYKIFLAIHHNRLPAGTEQIN